MPGNALAWHNLAVTCQRQGWIDLAAGAYLSVLQLDPDNVTARRNLDVLYGQ